MFDGKILTTLTMLAVFAGACLLSLSLPAKAAFMPLLVAIPGAILCAAQLAIDLMQTPKPAETITAEKDVARPPQGARSEAAVFVWLALFTAILLGFGFLAGSPLIVGMFVRFSAREPWRNALFAACGTFAAIYGVFAWFLELSLFQGIVLEKLLA